MVSSTPFLYSGKNILCPEKVAVAILSFDYDNIQFPRASQSELRVVNDNVVTIYKKNQHLQDEYIYELEKLGLRQLADRPPPNCVGMFNFFPNENEIAWFKFKTDNVPLLQSRGWQIEIDKYHIVQGK